jgi:TonB family protein
VKLALALVAMIVISYPVCGQQSQPSSTGSPRMGVSILSDTEDVDFTPYVSRLLTTIRHNWELADAYPESAGTGKLKVVFITFHIAPDGSIWASDPVLERTSGVRAFDNAAMVAIRTSSPFEALPPEFHGPHLELRIAFMYNHREILIEFKSLTVIKLAKDEPLQALVTYHVDGDSTLDTAWVRQKAAGSFDNLHINDFAVLGLSTEAGYKGPFDEDNFRKCVGRYVLGWIGPNGLGVPFTGDPPHLVNLSFDAPSPLDLCEMNVDLIP